MCLVIIVYAAYFIILGSNILPELSDTQMELVSVAGLTLALLLAGSLTNIYSLIYKILEKDKVT